MSKTDTCMAVVKALGQAMRTTSIDRVRVTDLCREAAISRATFYEHFPDVYGVATWAWDHLMESSLYLVGETYDCYTAHLRKFQALRQHREFFGNAMRTVGYESICQHGGRRMAEIFEEAAERGLGRGLTEHERLELEFFNTGAKHMTRHWVERGMVEEPEEMARLFTEFAPDFLLPLLEPKG